ncbi:MAG: FecR family protein [Gammaproteobacteria bacterium]
MNSSIRVIAMALVVMIAGSVTITPVHASPWPAMAQTPKAADGREIAGRAIVVVGRVMVRGPDGGERRLSRRAFLYAGDVIVTGKRGYTQIRYRDGGLMSLRPDTEFAIERFHYSGREDGNEVSAFKLLRGGFRTITGAIGKTNKANYRVATPVATIGIRGTHYGARVCGPGQCRPPAPPEGGEQQPPVPPGLYMSTREGETTLTNQTGTTNHPAGTNSFVGGQNQSPESQLAPFGFVFDNYEEDAGEDEEEGGDGGQGDGGDGQAQGDEEGGDGEEQSGDGDAEGDDGGDAESGEGQEGDAAEGESEGQEGGDAQSDDAQGDDAEGGDGQPSDSEGAADDGGAGGADDGGAQGGDVGGSPDEGAGGLADLGAGGDDGLGLAPITLDTGAAVPITSGLSVVGDSPTVDVNAADTAGGSEVVSDTDSLVGAFGLISLFPSDGGEDGGVVGGLVSDGDANLIIVTASGFDNEGALRQGLIEGDRGGEFQSSAGRLTQLGSLDGRIVYGAWDGDWEAQGSTDPSFTNGRGTAHFIYSPKNGLSSLSGSGTAVFTYRDDAGTRPTDLNGNEGSVTHAALIVDLSNQSIDDFRVDATVNGVDWIGLLDNDRNPDSSLDTAMSDGLYLDGAFAPSGSENDSEAMGKAAFAFVSGGDVTQAISSFFLRSADESQGINGTLVFDQRSDSADSQDNVALVAYLTDDQTATIPTAAEIEITGTGENNEAQVSTVNGNPNVVTGMRSADAGGDSWRSGVARLVEYGSDPTGLTWGRWDEDWDHRSSSHPNEENSGSSAYFMHTTNAANEATQSALRNVATQSSASFMLSQAPRPTDYDGNVGSFVTNGSFTGASFDLGYGHGNLEISNYQVHVRVDGIEYQGTQSGVADYGVASTSGFELNVNNGHSNGSASVVLVGNPGGSQVPNDAISGYHVQDPSSGRHAVGVIHFKKQ